MALGEGMRGDFKAMVIGGFGVVELLDKAAVYVRGERISTAPALRRKS